jgi:general secretion pathway protein G
MLKSGNRVIDRAIGCRARGVAARVSTASSDAAAATTSDRSWLERGFTMIELLVVVSLIVILATMGMTQYRSSVIHAREATLKEDLFRIRDSIDQYYADKGQYPSTLDALVSDGYLRKIPEDPFTKNSTSWQTVPAEPDPNNPVAEPGVFDVKSGSDGTALDGSKYAEW